MSLDTNEPISFDFYRTVPQADIDTNLVFRTKLRCNHSSKGPLHLDSSKFALGFDPSVKVLTRAGVSNLCEVEADLRKIPISLFTKKRNSKGAVYYVIEYSLVLVPSSASLIFELHFNGLSYGMVRSRY